MEKDYDPYDVAARENAENTTSRLPNRRHAMNHLKFWSKKFVEYISSDSIWNFCTVFLSDNISEKKEIIKLIKFIEMAHGDTMITYEQSKNILNDIFLSMRVFNDIISKAESMSEDEIISAIDSVFLKYDFRINDGVVKYRDLLPF